jgi:glutathione S-transferase
MIPTLYYIPGSAAMAPHAALEEIGAPFELRKVQRDAEGRSPPEYLAVNPLGRVPAYVDGAFVLWESAAITIYLADKHPEAGLLPPPASDERAVAVRWLVYLTNTVQATFLHYAYPERLVTEAAVDAVRAGAGTHLAAAFEHIDEQLGDGPYLLGDSFSAADLYLHMLTRWCRRLPRKAWTLPNVGRHYQRLNERPSVARMLAGQGIVAYPDDY